MPRLILAALLFAWPVAFPVPEASPTPTPAPSPAAEATAATSAATPAPSATPAAAETPITTPEEGTAGAVAPAPAGLEITWFGQSCFLMRTPGKTAVLMDPVAFGIGFTPPTVRADLVTISHEHPDHDNVKMVEVAGSAAGGAEVIHGVTRTGWNDVDESVGDVHVTSVRSFHDTVKGAKYGRNAIFVFDVEGRRVVHLGDLGTPLDAAQIKAIGKVDVLMVPVGGTYTLDAAGANQVIAALHPRAVVFPMHYKTGKLKIRELADLTAFLAGKTNVYKAGSHYVVPQPGAAVTEPTIVLLEAE